MLAGAALLYAMVGRGLPNYDTLYFLVWGRQMTGGETPDLEATLAPTPHPLAHLGSIALSPLSNLESDGIHGEPATTAVIVLAFVFLALLGWVVFALGRAWFGVWAGVLAAAIVLTRVPILDFGARVYIDIPYLVLVLGALLVETHRSRAGGPVLGLLALAGLLRPEAWLFSFAYLVYLVWPGLQAGSGRGAPERMAALRDALPLAVLAASAPVIWAASDLLITGDALHSLLGTRDSAELLGRITGIDEVPATMPRRLGEILRAPVLLAAAGGGILVLLTRRDREMRLAVGAGVVSVAAFCVLAAAGLPIITRYLLLTSVILALFAGAGVVGWRDMPKGSWRTGAMGFAAVAALALVAFVPDQVDRVDRLRAALERQDRIQDGLADVLRGADVCEPLTVPNRRPIPLLALWLDRDPTTIRNAQVAPPRTGTYVVPQTEKIASDYILDKRDRDRTVPALPAAFSLRGAQNEYWLLGQACSSQSEP